MHVDVYRPKNCVRVAVPSCELTTNPRTTKQICPEVEPEAASETVSEVLDTSLTPAALKKLSKSVMDLSAPSLSDVTDISKSTASIFTDGGKLRKILKGSKAAAGGSTASLAATETTTLGSVESVAVSTLMMGSCCSLLIVVVSLAFSVTVAYSQVLFGEVVMDLGSILLRCLCW